MNNKNKFSNYNPSATKAKNPGTNKMPSTGLVISKKTKK
jgi:hypothetical protein